jgi:methyl-accepting chemotaxis protein
MRLTIGRKLGLGFGIPLVLLALIGIAVFLGLNTLSNAARGSIEAQQTIEFMERGMKLLLTERILLSHQFATGEETTAAETREDYMQEWTHVVENTTVKNNELVMEIQRAVTLYHNYLDKAQSTYETNPNDASEAIRELDDADIFFIQIVRPTMDDLLSTAEIEKSQLVDILENQIIGTMRIAIIVVVIGIIISVFSALTIRRGLTNAALYLSSAAESISRGDLDTPIIAETGDEMEDLARSIERMRVSLKAAIERLRRRT